MSLARNALLWASRNEWLSRHFPRYRFAQAAVRRFMPGTTVDAAIDAAKTLQPHGIGTVFTRVGENLESLDEARAEVDHYLDVLDRVAELGLGTQVSIKLTHLGLDIDPGATADNLRTLAERAAQRGTAVFVDMEDSSYVDRTLDLFRSALHTHTNVGICLQAYLFRTETDLSDLLLETAAIRLVKGAYMEPASVAFPKKSDVDENFFRLGQTLLRAAADHPDKPKPVFGTHDIALIERLAKYADAEGIARDAWEIHMLYGIRTSEQRRLAAEGHRVRVLVSYGEQWFPWYVRRLAERPANVWFVVKSMVSR
jgi:proline dehydrogenase